MRCQRGVTGTVSAVGEIEDFGAPQTRAIGRTRAVTRADRGPGKLERGGRLSPRSSTSSTVKVTRYLITGTFVS
jgi:hypothetical protein